MSPSRSNRIVLPSGETSSDIHVPSSVVNSIFLSVLSGSSSSFLSFFSSFLSSSFAGSCANDASGTDKTIIANRDIRTRTSFQPVMTFLRELNQFFHWAWKAKNINQLQSEFQPEF